LETVRRGALETLRGRSEASELLAVALNADHRDVALAAVDLIDDRAGLEQVAARGKCKPAVKRARFLLRTMDEQARTETEAANEGVVEPPEPPQDPAPPGLLAVHNDEPAAPPDAPRLQTVQQVLEQEADKRRARLEELAAELQAAAGAENMSDARKRMAIGRREWDQLSEHGEVGAALADRVKASIALWTTREQDAREADDRVRRDALARLQELIQRVEPQAQDADLSVKQAERALREVRVALANVPPLPSRQDFHEVTRRLKAVQTALLPKLQELRETEDWQRWANATVQEQLCARMEALQTVEDLDLAAREIRDLQHRWREAADVPRAHAEALWRRFKTAHDLVRARCEAHVAARAETLRDNLARRIALCERAEALADSTSWLETAEAIKALQNEWKTIGPVPRGSEKAVWERFRQPCDRFFTRRNEDLAQRKAVWADNLAKKTALCERAEALASSTDWEPTAAAIKRLQAEWKAIGPVKKSRSDAIWQRFRGACDQFFTSYTHRDDAAHAARVAEREAVCVALERLIPDETGDPTPTGPELLGTIRGLQSRWKHSTASQLADAPGARALDQRYADAFARVCATHADAVRGTDLDPEANRSRMEALVTRVEDLAKSVAGVAGQGAADPAISRTANLAAMLKEALASNTIGGGVDDRSRYASAVEQLRQAQAAWSRLGPVPDAIRRPLLERFQRAGRFIVEKAGAASRAAISDKRSVRR
jgi:hypothetical protein